ncbi:hypothetical protein Tco_1030583 [Tanacetum coccineum]|uniref:Uncharacterized protein n=1 Tax=Tanacetum coccineum TaxID=301880 RepID=A0ABQ5G6N1_9ASTR
MGTKTHDWYATIDHRTQVEKPTRILSCKAEKIGASSRAPKAILEDGYMNSRGRYHESSLFPSTGSPTSSGQRRADDWESGDPYAVPFKCFLDDTKGYHQINYGQDDEEKKAFQPVRKEVSQSINWEVSRFEQVPIQVKQKVHAPQFERTDYWRIFSSKNQKENELDPPQRKYTPRTVDLIQDGGSSWWTGRAQPHLLTEGMNSLTALRFEFNS